MQAVSQKTGHPLIGCKRRLGNVTSGSRAGKLTNHIAFLDELRGVAALSVVLLHASQIFGFSLGSYAYLAVDFFFCLSGFVLANGYDQKLRSGGLRSSAFFLKRLARLYPMIVVGVAVGVLAAVFASEPHISLHDIPILTVGALLLLPLGLLAGQEAFSINSPLWSLCFEMVASVVYGSAARRKIRLWGDVAFLAFFAVALFQIVGIEGTIGPVGFSNWRTFLEGFVRVRFFIFCRCSDFSLEHQSSRREGPASDSAFYPDRGSIPSVFRPQGVIRFFLYHYYNSSRCRSGSGSSAQRGAATRGILRIVVLSALRYSPAYYSTWRSVPKR